MKIHSHCHYDAITGNQARMLVRKDKAEIYVSLVPCEQKRKLLVELLQTVGRLFPLMKKMQCGEGV